MKSRPTQGKLRGGFERLLLNKNAMFWTLQIMGWGGLFIVSSLTLNLFYDHFQIEYISHNMVRSIFGIITTMPLRIVYSRVWKYTIGKRLIAVFSATLLMSILWTVVIIQFHELMTGEYILLYDYGGWIYSSIFIFMSWSASYHGVKYFLLLQEEHKTLLKSQSEKRHQLLKRSEAENRAKLAKLKFLSYQLNPHFLFNAMNSVYSMIETSNNNGAKKMISQLSQYLRVSLEHQEDILIPLRHELKILNMYLDIEKIRFGDRLQVEFNCSDESKEHKMPIFLLQPLVENSIKHAISQSLDGGVISISSYVKNDQLVIVQEDSGSGNKNETSIKSESLGIGLANTKERLSVLYQEQVLFEQSTSELGGIKIIIKLPLKNKDFINE